MVRDTTVMVMDMETAITNSIMSHYSGRDNPSHPEIWFNYFLRMVLLHSNKVCEISESSSGEELEGSLSYLEARKKNPVNIYNVSIDIKIVYN